MKIKHTGISFIIFGAVFLSVGLLTIGIGIGMFASYQSFKRTAVETDAIITDIDVYRRSSGGESKTSRIVWIRYGFDGEEYENTLGYYSSGMRKGDSVKIYVNPDNPSDIKANSILAEIILILMGLPFSAVGGGFIISSVKKSILKKSLLTDGEQMSGIITNVYPDTSIKINGRNPFKADCKVVDPYSGETYLYSSEGVMNDISCLVGASVTVYVDRGDRSRYYVDIESAAADCAAENKIYDYR